MEKEPHSRNSILLSRCCMCLHQNIFQKLLRAGELRWPGENGPHLEVCIPRNDLKLDYRRISSG